jgi:putative FmdB family regulatory protein
MATYEFVCSDCENEYEVYVQGFLKEHDRACPKCGSENTRQKFTSFLRNLGAGGDSSGSCGPRGRSGFG